MFWVEEAFDFLRELVASAAPFGAGTSLHPLRKAEIETLNNAPPQKMKGLKVLIKSLKEWEIVAKSTLQKLQSAANQTVVLTFLHFLWK